MASDLSPRPGPAGAETGDSQRSRVESPSGAATPSRASPGGIVIGLVTVGILVAALSARSGLALGLVLLAPIFIPLEKLFALRPQRILRRGWETDLVHFGVNTVLTNVGLIVPVVTAGVLLRALVPAAVHDGVAAEPRWLQFAEALLVAELGSYLGHRAAHRIPVLWRFHKVHHSIQEMDWLAAGHLHPVDQVWTRSCAVVPLFALGFSRATFGAFLLFASFQAVLIHANLRLRFGPLRWLIATPEFHHWHHSSDPLAFSSNFAGELPLIDALFGTLHLPRGEMPAGYGIADPQPAGYLRQLAWPFRRVTA